MGRRRSEAQDAVCRETHPRAVGPFGVMTNRSDITQKEFADLLGLKTPAGRTEWQPVQVSRLLAA